MGQIVSHIKVNPSYNPNDIVLPMKEDIEFIKVKEKFYDAHPECERIY